MSEPINKEWMSEKERGVHDLFYGSRGFLKFAKWKLGGKKCPCPCKKCRNRYWLTYKDVEHHLVSNGIEKSYCVWTLHGEDLSNIAVHPPVVANIGETTIGDVAIEMEDTEEETIGEVGLGWETLLTLLFGLHERVVGDGESGPEFDEPYVPEPDLGKRYYEYKKKARKNCILVELHVKKVPVRTSTLFYPCCRTSQCKEAIWLKTLELV
ncbi:hypothetical protein IFM89_009005 [Coptis chinensis]|uniref:Transposase-associated domain-containing protein n=1 Tax=Coptis chinensis TaxID=261450 RepID=A0A835HL98_9MAGN|nr:hypothetical protein IFM89_009005 [Coptis chinensis]